MSAKKALTRDLDVLLVVDDEPALPVRTTVAYAGNDPLVVTMTVMAADHGVRWTIASMLSHTKMVCTFSFTPPVERRTSP